MKGLSKYFDHTLLKPDARENNIKKLCEEAKENEFYSVCINGANIEETKKFLEGSDIKIATVVGFPLGATPIRVKAFETEEYIKLGADEIDLVINIGKLKDGNLEYLREEISTILNICKNNGKLLKCIIETCLLTEEEKINICKMLLELRVDFIKTSTGFSTGGAKASDIQLIKNIVGDNIKIKASGGIRTLTDALTMIAKGADRIGASTSVSILEEDKK